LPRSLDGSATAGSPQEEAKATLDNEMQDHVYRWMQGPGPFVECTEANLENPTRLDISTVPVWQRELLRQSAEEQE